MSLADPQTITINGAAISLPRVQVTGDGSKYSSADGLTQIRFSSLYGKRIRRTARLDTSKISADPYLPATNVKLGASVYVVYDYPVAGFSSAEIHYQSDGLMGLMLASSGLVTTKLLGGES